MLHDRNTHCTYGTETINIKLGDKKQIIYIMRYQTSSSMYAVVYCILLPHSAICTIHYANDNFNFYYDIPISVEKPSKFTKIFNEQIITEKWCIAINAAHANVNPPESSVATWLWNITKGCWILWTEINCSSNCPTTSSELSQCCAHKTNTQQTE